LVLVEKVDNGQEIIEEILEMTEVVLHSKV
jgi:hypothetical protein